MRRNVLFNTAGSLLFYICQAAITLLVTALAGAEANGLLATGMTIANVCLSAASYGMRTFQVSDLSGKYTDRSYLFSRYITLTAAGLGCLVFSFVNSYSAEQRWVIFLYTGYRLIESWSDVWHGYLQKAERIDIVGISFGVRGIVTALSVTLGLLLTKDLVLTLAVLFALNAAYVLVVDIPLARRRADFKRTGGAGVKTLLVECLPLAVYAFLNTTIASVPRYYCERILGSVKLGYFNNVFLPVMILQVAVIYLFVPFITTFARLWTDRNGKGFYKGLRLLGAALVALWIVGTIGVALLARLVGQAAAIFGGCDVEIVEAHHNRKADAPSGTALLLADAVKARRPDAAYVFGRAGHHPRQPNEIGIHSLRMGNVVGEHEVIFATDNQTITLKHQAHDRALFAEGALAAADFLQGQPAGLYHMEDLLGP